MNNNSNKKKTIKVKQSLGWNLAFYLLQMINNLPEVMSDEHFYKKFNELAQYTSDKITSPHKGDITDLYVIAEQEIDQDS